MRLPLPLRQLPFPSHGRAQAGMHRLTRMDLRGIPVAGGVFLLGSVGMAANLLGKAGRSWWVPVLYGVIGILFGLVALAKPFQAALAMAWAFGVMALAEGITSVVALFAKDVAVSKGWLALYALASIVFGLLAVANPAATAGALILLLAAWLIVGGVFRIVFAIRVRKEIQGEWLIALSGVLAIVLGLLFIGSPGLGLFATTVWVGAAALVYGAIQVVAGFKLRKLQRVPA